MNISESWIAELKRCLRNPVKLDTKSVFIYSPEPVPFGQPFQSEMDSYSGVCWTPIPL